MHIGGTGYGRWHGRGFSTANIRETRPTTMLFFFNYSCFRRCLRRKAPTLEEAMGYGKTYEPGAHWARKELGRAFALASEGVLAHLVPLWSISSPRRGPSWSQHPSGRLRHGSVALSLQGRKSQEDLGRQPPSCSSARVLGDVLSASGATTLVGRCWLSREGGGFRSSGRS